MYYFFPIKFHNLEIWESIVLPDIFLNDRFL